MSKKTQQVQAWKFLIEQVNQVQDPLLKRAMIADFRERALHDWGWDPATGKSADSQNAELDTWEQDFLERVRLGQQLGVHISGPNNETSEARANMTAYVRDGGTLDGIPDNIRTPDIIELYNKCKQEEFEELMRQADNVSSGPELIGDILPRVIDQLAKNTRKHDDEQTHNKTND